MRRVTRTETSLRRRPACSRNVNLTVPSLAFVPDVLARTDMGNMPLRRILIKEALLTGFKLALDDAETLSTASEGPVH